MLLNFCRVLAIGILTIAPGISSELQAAAGQHDGILPAGLEATQEVPWTDLSVKISADYEGGGLVVAATAEGAELRCDFQKLAGKVTLDGLWLHSTSGSGTADRFRIKAMAIGRDSDVPAARVSLASSGSVATDGKLVTYSRPGVTEEYSINPDGVRQDFLVNERPVGTGRLCLELEVNGAKVENPGQGVELIVEGEDRRIAYHRLQVTDASGRVLPAQMEPPTSGRPQLVIRVDDTEAIYPVRIDPTFSDANWNEVGTQSYSGANRDVTVSTVDMDGNLYIGGEFSKLGTIDAKVLAKWDGHSWSPVGNENFYCASVTSMAASGRDVYIAGKFSFLGTIIEGIVSYNGTGWGSFYSPLNGTVRAMALWQGNLYAAGDFTEIGGVPANNIAKWDGSSWSALGSGTNDTINCLTSSGGKFYAGGEFTTAGGIPANRVASWNGSSWSTLSTGISSPSGCVFALTADGNDLYAGGFFSRAGDVDLYGIAKWNGTAWSALGSSIAPYPNRFWAVYALSFFKGRLYVGGDFTHAGGLEAYNIATWSNNAWGTMDGGIGPEMIWSGWYSMVRTLAVAGDNLYIGGTFLWAGSITAPFVANWDGDSWGPIGRGLSGSVTSVVSGNGEIYMAGEFLNAEAVAVNHLAKWNGTAWSALGSGTNGVVSSLVWWNGELYAGGDFSTAGGVAASNIAKWNGSSWTPLGSGTNGSVQALAVCDGQLFAAGWFDRAGGVSAPYIARWNGLDWSGVGSGADSPVLALTTGTNGKLYAGGSFSSMGGVEAKMVAAWDGTSWSSLGSGIQGLGWFSAVYALAEFQGEIHAGGSFYTAGGNPAANIAKWNGSRWEALGSGVDQSVYALTTLGNHLYAGGGFATAGGLSAKRIARWDGGAWSALGSGVKDSVSNLKSVFAFGTMGGSLYAGGSFTNMGGKFANHIAVADIGLPPIITSPTTAAAVAGQPFTYQIVASNSPTGFSAAGSLPGPLPPGGSSLPPGLALNSLTGLISGSPTTAGPINILLTASNALGSGSATLLLNVSTPAAAVTNWAASAGLTGENAIPDATPFDDGVSNLLKYAFNMNAGGPDSSILTPNGGSGLPQIVIAGSADKPVLRVEFLRRRNSGLVYTPEQASSLDGFTAISGQQTVTPINDQWERVTVESTAPATAATSGFARVRVTIP